MAWIKVFQEMPRHRKTLKLAGLLGLDRRSAIGLLVDLWTWALDNATKDGSLGEMTEQDIAMALDWPTTSKKTEKLMDALMQSGFLESVQDGARVTYVLHDWYDYTGKLNDKRAKNRERMRDSRAQNVQRTDVAHAPDVQPLELEKELELEIYSSATATSAGMRAICDAYENGVGKLSGSAMHELPEYLKAGLTPEVIVLAITEAVDNNAASWKYIKAILDRCLEQKILTEQDWKASLAQRQAQKNRSRGKKPSAQSSAGAPSYDKADLEALLLHDVDGGGS